MSSKRRSARTRLEVRPRPIREAQEPSASSNPCLSASSPAALALSLSLSLSFEHKRVPPPDALMHAATCTSPCIWFAPAASQSLLHIDNLEERCILTSLV